MYEEDIKITIVNILKNIEEIEFAYLFGSYSNNTQTLKSDIDIAIFIKNGFNLFDTHLNIHHKLEIHLKHKIDIVVLNNAKNFHLVKDILNKGILLKDTIDDTRQIYECEKIHEIIDYFDFKRLLNVA